MNGALQVSFILSPTFLFWIAALFRYINMAHDIDIVPSQLWFCRAISAIIFTSSLCSTLFILSMTFERFYSIIRPHKAASFNTVKRAQISIVCIIIFSTVFNFPQWIVTSDEKGSRNCIPYAIGVNTIQVQVYYWSQNIVNFLLPFVLLLTMNAVIINTLRKRSNSILIAKRDGQGRAEGQSQKVKNSEMQIFVTLLLVTFSYLILNSPTYVYLFLVFARVNRNTPYLTALFYLVYSVGHKALYTNYGINFFLYVISGKKFRSDLALLLKHVLHFFTCNKLRKDQSTSGNFEPNTCCTMSWNTKDSNSRNGTVIEFFVWPCWLNKTFLSSLNSWMSVADPGFSRGGGNPRRGGAGIKFY